jgi:hypothetical protein
MKIECLDQALAGIKLMDNYETDKPVKALFDEIETKKA